MSNTEIDELKEHLNEMIKEQERVNDDEVFDKLTFSIAEAKMLIAEKEKADALKKALEEIKLEEHPDFSRWMYIQHDDNYLNIITGAVLKVQVFNSEMNKYIPKHQVLVNDEPKWVKMAPSAHLYMTNIVRLRVYAPEYSPGSPVVFKDNRGNTKLNTYSEQNIPHIQDHTTPEAIELIDRIKQHFYNFYTADTEHILQWLSHNVRYPGVKIGWGLVFIGIEGTGKGISEKLLSVSMGTENVINTSSRIINTSFTDWMAGACVRTVDELSIETSSKKAVMDTLKDAITNAYISINRKRLSILNGVRNTQNYIITSNHRDALPVSETDRRFLIVDDGIEDVKIDVLERFNNKKYYRELYDAIWDNPGIIRSWLLSIDMTSFNAATAPFTEAKKEMHIESQSHEYHFIMNTLDDINMSVDFISSYIITERFNKRNTFKIHSGRTAKVLKQLGYRKHPDHVQIDNIKHTIYHKKDFNIVTMPRGKIVERIKQMRELFNAED